MSVCVCVCACVFKTVSGGRQQCTCTTAFRSMHGPTAAQTKCITRSCLTTPHTDRSTRVVFAWHHGQPFYSASGPTLAEANGRLFLFWTNNSHQIHHAVLDDTTKKFTWLGSLDAGQFAADDVIARTLPSGKLLLFWQLPRPQTQINDDHTRLRFEHHDAASRVRWAAFDGAVWQQLGVAPWPCSDLPAVHIVDVACCEKKRV